MPKSTKARAVYAAFEKKVCALYRKMTISEVAEQVGVGQKAVVGALKNAGVERRARGKRPKKK